MRLFATALAALLLTTPCPSHAQSVSGAAAGSVNLQEIADRAGVIAVGICVSLEETWQPIGGADLPVTRYTFTIEQWLAGPGGETLEFTQYGHANYPVQSSRAIQGLPAFAPGEPWLLCLTVADSTSGLCTAVGLDQGAFRREGEGESARYVNARANAGLMSGVELPTPLSATDVRGGDLLPALRALVAETGR